jgi:hypothetical protein
VLPTHRRCKEVREFLRLPVTLAVGPRDDTFSGVFVYLVGRVGSRVDETVYRDQVDVEAFISGRKMSSKECRFRCGIRCCSLRVQEVEREVLSARERKDKPGRTQGVKLLFADESDAADPRGLEGLRLSGSGLGLS